MHNPNIGTLSNQLCKDVSACSDDILEYAINGYSTSSEGPGAAIVGIATDGHVIIGPYKSAG